jgi:hypothetical protein
MPSIARRDEAGVECRPSRRLTRSTCWMLLTAGWRARITCLRWSNLRCGRQIALTADPVHSIELRYQLVDLLQQHDPAAAAAEEDAIYREHGKILGVVRATVDYDWGHERKPQAVSVLLESAEALIPDSSSRFELEAARKLTELGEYPRAKQLLESLLSEKPARCRR